MITVDPSKIASGSTTAQTQVNKVYSQPNYQLGFQQFVTADPAQIIKSTTPSVGALKFPSDLGKYYITFSFYDYKRPNILSPLQLVPKNDIALPIPTSLVDGNSIGYAEDSVGGAVGFAMNEAAAGLRGSNDVYNQDGILAAGQSILGKITTDGLFGTTAGTGAAFAAALAANSQLGNVALQMIGVAQNPFLTVLLKGPNFKRHRFQWLVFPRSERETFALTEIVRQFKFAGYPALSAYGAVYTYPSIILPKLYPNDQHLYKFKPCVLETLAMNYAPVEKFVGIAGMDGAPAAFVIDMQLLEIELWLKRDFEI